MQGDKRIVADILRNINGLLINLGGWFDGLNNYQTTTYADIV